MGYGNRCGFIGGGRPVTQAGFCPRRIRPWRLSCHAAHGATIHQRQTTLKPSETALAHQLEMNLLRRGIKKGDRVCRCGQGRL